MPLPDSSLPLSLHVHSNAVQSKPKRAMIVRMSAETLDALDASSDLLSFDFGNVPGIYIGDAFFPMRPQKESSPHELYLRAASAAKPMAPLKLHANVIGKFMVERQLGIKVTDKVRHQTMVAKQQHLERQAILLDQPPIPAHSTKNPKRKTPGSGTVVNKTPVSDQLRIAATSSRKVSPLPPPTKANADVRRRLVHCLAISPRLSEEAVKMVGGASISSSARDDLLVLLQDVAERNPQKKGDKSPRLWKLKPQTWIEVRPYEWPKLTEPERTTMARQARMAFQALKIPESDPVWENVRYRPTASALPPPAPVPASTPAPAPSAAKSNASRRVPGSGYQAKPALPPSLPQKPSPTPAGSHARKTIPNIPPKPTKKEDESDREHERQREREREKRAREKERRREEEREQERVELEKREKARQKEREAVEREKRRKEKEKDRERERELEREREREREKEREREEMEREKRQREKDRILKEAEAASALKRKAVMHETEVTLDAISSKSSLTKRRKLDDGSSVASSSSKPRDPGLPKKPVHVHEASPVPRIKIKKDSSPAQAPLQERRAPSKPERPSKQPSSAKPRRRSPIYTSSEDEGEIPQPRKRKQSPPSVSDRSISSDQLPPERPPRAHRPTRTSYPPSTDHAALRALYQSQYTTYLGTFSKMVAQKRKIEAVLNGDSDAEVDVMDPDQLFQLSSEHKAVKTELEHIHALFTRGAVLVGGGGPD